MTYNKQPLGQPSKLPPKISRETQNKMRIHSPEKLKIPYQILPDPGRNFYQLTIVIKMNSEGKAFPLTKKSKAFIN